MVDGYEECLDAIITALETVINSTSSFNSDITYFDYRKKHPHPLSCRCNIDRDTFSADGAKLTHHITTFTLDVRYVCKGTREDLNTIIGYVGEIVDAIEADRTLDSTYIERTEVSDADYSMQINPDTINHHAYISIYVEHIRNA